MSPSSTALSTGDSAGTPCSSFARLLLFSAVAALSACNAYIGGKSDGQGVVPATPGPGAAGSGNVSSSGASTGGVGAPQLDCSQASVPPAPLRRLTREQYANTIKNALNVTVDLSALAADQTAGVFASNFGVVIDDLGTEQYASLAESIATQAAPTSRPTTPSANFARKTPACRSTPAAPSRARCPSTALSTAPSS